MKKILLSVCMAAACGSMATAGIIAIMGDNIKYTGNADVVRVATGSRGDTSPVYTDAFTLDWETVEGKSMVVMSIGSYHWYAYSKGTLAPTPGITLTKVNLIVRDPDYFQGTIPGFTLNENVYTWTGSVSYPDDLVIQPDLYDDSYKVEKPNINAPRPYIIEVEYSGTPTSPLMPVVSNSDRMIAANTPITLTTPTPDAKIYYTTNGEWPDQDAILYNGPINLTDDCTLMAVAVDSKNNMSSTLIQPYIVAEAGTTIVNFDFTKLDGLTLKNTTWADHTSGRQIVLTDERLEIKDAALFTAPSYTDPYIYAPSSTCGAYGEYYLLRVGGKMSIMAEVLPNQVITDMIFTGSGLTKANVLLNAGVNGKLTYNPTDYYNKGGYVARYTADASKRSNSVAVYRKAGTVQFENIWVAYKNPASSGVDAIDVDNSNAPVVYYNLQGVQVAADNLTPGIYVKRQGSKAEKILVK